MWASYRVGSDVDALLLAVLDQVVALQDGVALDLVGSGNDASAVDDGLELSEVSMVHALKSASYWVNGVYARARSGGWRHRRSGPCSSGAESWLWKIG